MTNIVQTNGGKPDLKDGQEYQVIGGWMDGQSFFYDGSGFCYEDHAGKQHWLDIDQIELIGVK